MGKERLRRMAALSDNSRDIKVSLFGKRSLVCSVTTLYVAQAASMSRNGKGHAFEKTYDEQLYGYLLYDLSDLKQLVSLVAQGCKKDEISVAAKKEDVGVYKLVFEITL